MKLTNGEIFMAQEPLKKLMGEKLPVKTSYGLAKIAQKLTPQLSVIQTVREGLFKTYGTKSPNGRGYNISELIPEVDKDGNSIKDEKGNVTLVPNPNYDKFTSEHRELMAQEIEIVYDTVKLPETLEIEPAVLMALDKFIKVA